MNTSQPGADVELAPSSLTVRMAGAGRSRMGFEPLSVESPADVLLPTAHIDSAGTSPTRPGNSSHGSHTTATGLELDGAAVSGAVAADSPGGSSSSSDSEAKAAMEAAVTVEHAAEHPPPAWSWRGFLLFCGPGLLMSVAYLDPGNLQADVQAGAQTGFSLLWWFAAVSLGCGFTFQCLSGRLGLATGRDLAQHCGTCYPLAARILLWLMLEIAIVAVDIQETVGCSQALYILSQGTIPLWAGCLVVSITAFGLLLLERRGARWLEAVFGLSIAVLAVAMAVNFFRAGVPAGPLFKGLFVPKLSSTSLLPAIAALGALVTPYNLFFHSSIVNSRRHDASSEGRVKVLLNYLRAETMLALLLAFFINLCVVSVFAVGFYGNSEVDPNDIGLQAAGELLGQRFGTAFKYCWAVGLFASGQVATVALTYAGQLIMAGLLRMRISGFWRYSATRMVALVPALVVALVSTGSNKFDALNQRLNVVQSMLLPFALLPAIHMTSSREVMGRAFVSFLPLTLFVSFVAAVVLGVNGYFLVDTLRSDLPQTDASYALWPLLIAAYYCVNGYYALGPERASRWGAATWRHLRAGATKAADWAKGVRWRDPKNMLEVQY